jgi:transposase
MIFVGADVHVRNSYFYATDECGRRLAHGRRANASEAVRAFCEELLRQVDGELQTVSFALESTTNSRAAARLFEQAARAAGFEDVRAEVLNARKLRIIAESVAKCDALDARVINQLSRANLKLPTCYVPDDDVFALREHLRSRSDFVRLRTMCKNRVHAVLHRRGILAPEKGLFTKDGRKFLEQTPLDDAGRTILTRYLMQVDQLDELLAESEGDLRKLQRLPRWAIPSAILQSMPGIGLITALTILAELGDVRRFRSRAAVANYAGLVPIVRDSNNKHDRGGITHCGSAHLRAVLVEAAWTAVPRVPLYQALFDRIRERRGKPVAIVAVARRMLEDAVRMLWKNEAFRYVPVPTAAVAPATAVATASAAAGAPPDDGAQRRTASEPRGSPPAPAAVASSVAG